MKYKYLFPITTLLSCFTLTVSAQFDSISLRKNCNLNWKKIFTNVTHTPSPKGNFNALVMNHGAIKEAMYSANKSQDSLVIRFIVKKDGSICNPLFIDSSNNLMKSAVLNLLYQSIPWQAGTYDGGQMLDVFVTMKMIFNYDPSNKALTAKVSFLEPH